MLMISHCMGDHQDGFLWPIW